MITSVIGTPNHHICTVAHVICVIYNNIENLDIQGHNILFNMFRYKHMIRKQNISKTLNFVIYLNFSGTTRSCKTCRSFEETTKPPTCLDCIAGHAMEICTCKL